MPHPFWLVDGLQYCTCVLAILCTELYLLNISRLEVDEYDK